jgi:hypothetical protein
VDTQGFFAGEKLGDEMDASLETREASIYVLFLSTLNKILAPKEISV